jgi:hypothetical protein
MNTPSRPRPGELEPNGAGRTSRAAERDRQVVELSIAGEPIVEIGHRFGYVSPGPAIRLVDRAFDLLVPHLEPEMQRRLDMARLDRLLAAWWDRATADDANAARLVLDILTAKEQIRASEHSPDVLSG